MDDNLLNFIKYCLGYVKITREKRILSQQKYSVDLPMEYFGLSGLLNGDTDGKLDELIDLKLFYKYDPKDVPESEIENYEKEKELANKIEDIYNKYRNDQYTKQIILNFGYFEIEIPISDEDIVTMEEQQDDEEKVVKTKIDRYPLFTLPIRIEKYFNKNGSGEYSIYFTDPEIQINIGALEAILGEDLYFELLEEIGKYEIDGKLTLPIIDLDIFKEIWSKTKAQLRLKKANFNENSFSLEEMKIALSSKANYFLADDLAKLTQLTEEELSKTALTSWTKNEELNIENNAPHEKELYFPFLYDKYQLSTLSIIGNKAAIIQGPPGTGKSETISNILCHLAATGNRVLFVSQKAQALKVVKDKLKKLDVKYLFGYLPNPNSAQIGEDDEADGIAPQLSALGAYIEKIGYKNNTNYSTSIDEVVEKKDKNIKAINEAIDIQRKYYRLHQEFLKLKEYDIDISDFKCFAESFSSVHWQEIKKIKTEIEVLAKIIEKYKKSKEKKEFDLIFLNLDLNGKNFSEQIKVIRNDISTTGYDRHSSIFRKINNVNRNLRLRGIREKLPREIIDYIDDKLAKDISRNEQEESLNYLYNYCYYYENIQQLDIAEEKLQKELSVCGVDDKEFKILDEKIDVAKASDLEDIKNKILRVQTIKLELQELSKTDNINKINSELKIVEQERIKRVASYIQTIINRGITEKWKTGITIKQIVRKLASAFGKSKKAFKTFDNLRKDINNFNAILDLIPIWIMELDDASRIIPLEAGIFDYVILDEASQCNVAYTLPVMYRTNRVLFVGDSEQMRDSTIMFKSNRIFDELAHRYQIPEERQIKATGSAVQSVLDIAYKRGFMDRPLRYHYRSPAELIGFSNKYFYTPKGKELIPVNSTYLTYKDTNRVIIVHKVSSDWHEEFSDNINVAEAKEILKLFKKIRADERYHDKSVGILSFFNAQATYLRDIFEKEGFKEENDNYKISIIEGIQGDEKDIIFYSFVIRAPEQKNKYMPLTGEGGDIRAEINKGRVNVAFSRAKLQVHCFISLAIQDMPEKIWIKKYLEYAEENGEVTFHSTDLKKFDSNFEKDFYDLLHINLGREYKIQNQVNSCGFKIDFVLNNTKTGKRIAIECDGPCHFKDEIDETYGIHIESDEDRQHVLESAGWNFYRIKYADWINENFDRKTIIETLVDLLR
ncbi:MAG: AAA domain-containing protein [Candidatus Paceibacterota bacterium]|jgi:superfamily I DNA and/or RNA helicase/very-short-patch-repair endonuclease